MRIMLESICQPAKKVFILSSTFFYLTLKEIHLMSAQNCFLCFDTFSFKSHTSNKFLLCFGTCSGKLLIPYRILFQFCKAGPHIPTESFTRKVWEFCFPNRIAFVVSLLVMLTDGSYFLGLLFFAKFSANCQFLRRSKLILKIHKRTVI